MNKSKIKAINNNPWWSMRDFNLIVKKWFSLLFRHFQQHWMCHTFDLKIHHSFVHAPRNVFGQYFAVYKHLLLQISSAVHFDHAVFNVAESKKIDKYDFNCLLVMPFYTNEWSNTEGPHDSMFTIRTKSECIETVWASIRNSITNFMA